MSYPRMYETFHSCFSFHMCVNFMKKDSFTQFTVAICKPRHWNWNWNWYYKCYYFQLHKAYKHQTYHGGDLGWGDPTHQVTWHFDIVVTWQIKTLYLHLHKIYGPQTCQSGELGWGDPIYNVTWHIDHGVTWRIKNAIYLLSQDLWTPNIAGWWLPSRHTKSHDSSILQSRDK